MFPWWSHMMYQIEDTKAYKSPNSPAEGTEQQSNFRSHNKNSSHTNELSNHARRAKATKFKETLWYSATGHQMKKSCILKNHFAITRQDCATPTLLLGCEATHRALKFAYLSYGKICRLTRLGVPWLMERLEQSTWRCRSLVRVTPLVSIKENHEVFS